MKVFISSVIGGFEEYRLAAEIAIANLDHDVLRSEDFGATDVSSQVACLSAVRAADVTVVLLGERYGTPQDSELSATHEEFREARDRARLLVFEQTQVSMEGAQQALLDEAREWASGVGTGTFETPEDLSRAITQALVRLERRDAAGGVDLDELHARAVASAGQPSSSAGPLLSVALVGGPSQSLLRPRELDPTLVRFLKAEALTGSHAVLDTELGTTERIREAQSVVLTQENGSAVELQLDGTVRISTPAVMRYQDPAHRSGLGLSETFLAGSLKKSLELAGSILDHVDPTHRLSHLCLAAGLAGSGYIGWSPSPLSGGVGMALGAIGGPDPLVVPEHPYDMPRPALQVETGHAVADMITFLRAGYSGDQR
jgi:hypothetical protein